MESAFEKLASFFAHYPRLHYKKGETILRPYDQPRGVFYLKTGFVRQYSISPQGEELTLIILQPEDFFPIIWAINGSVYEYYMESMTPVVINSAPRSKFIQFSKDNPDVFWELTSRILIRMRGLMTRMQYLVFGDASHKVASILVICSERFGQNLTQGIVIQVPLTHQAIANLVGVSRETASVEVKKLERKGLIIHKGRNIVVKNLSELKKASHFG